MLQILNLWKEYRIKNGSKVVALKNINLSFSSRGMVFVTGKSGSGKSTFLNLIGGLDVPTSGEMRINNEPIENFSKNKLDAYRNTFIGFIFQEYNLLKHLTVGENISLAMELQNKNVTKQDLHSVLTMVQLENYQERKINELSGGEKQRVAIARALIKNPHIIIADEPTGAVDFETSVQIFEILKEISKERLVIIASHDKSLIKEYADRIIELKNGEVICDTNKTLTEEIEETSFFLPHLSLKSIVKQGINNMKCKKSRLIFTVLLSVIAFVLFGTADMISSYDKQEILLKSLKDEKKTSIVAKKEKYLTYKNKAAWYNDNFYIEQDEIDQLSIESGIQWKGIYKPSSLELNIEENYGDRTLRDSQFGLYISEFSGFIEFTEDDLKTYKFELLEGRLPDGKKDEVAISEYMYESFKIASYRNYTGPSCNLYKDDKLLNEEELSWDEYRALNRGILQQQGISLSLEQEPKCTTIKISEPKDLIGKSVFIGNRNYTITGIIDTGFNLNKYKNLSWRNIDRENDEADLTDILKIRAIENERNFGTIGLAFVGKGKVDEISSRYPRIVNIQGMTLTLENQAKGTELTYSSLMKLSDLFILDGIQESNDFVKIYEETKHKLEKREIILPFDDIPTWEMNLSREGDELWIQEQIDSVRKDWNLYVSFDDKRKNLSQTKYEVVGCTYSSNDGFSDIVYFLNLDDVLIVPDELFDELSEGRRGMYKYIIAPYISNTTEIEDFVRAGKHRGDNINYEILGEITSELKTLDGMIKGIAQMFRIASIVLVFLALLMFLNFMLNNVSHNKHEIGVMRALGARNIDIYRIFLCESILVAIINTIVSSVLLIGLASIGNLMIKQKMYVALSLLQFTERQFFLVVILSFAMALISCGIPIAWVVRRKPVEIINSF